MKPERPTCLSRSGGMSAYGFSRCMEWCCGEGSVTGVHVEEGLRNYKACGQRMWGHRDVIHPCVVSAPRARSEWPFSLYYLSL